MVPGIDVCGENTADNIAKMRHIVHIGEGGGDENIPHAGYGQDGSGGGLGAGSLRRQDLCPGELGGGNLCFTHWAFFHFAAVPLGRCCRRGLARTALCDN